MINARSNATNAVGLCFARPVGRRSQQCVCCCCLGGHVDWCFASLDRGVRQRSIYDQCVYQTLRMLTYVLRASAVERRLTLLQPAFVQVEQQDEEPKSGGRVLPILPVGPQVEAGPPVVLAMY